MERKGNVKCGCVTCSCLKIKKLNCCWSFSFAKLMFNCSKLLSLKFSNPKISRIPKKKKKKNEINK